MSPVSPGDSDKTVKVDHLGLTAKIRGAEVRWNDASGTHVAKLSARSLVGSAAQVPVQVKDKTVSKLHAEFELVNEGVWIKDLSSLNGTWFEGARVERILISKDAVVTVGASELSICFDKKESLVPLWPENVMGPMYGRSQLMRALFMRISQFAPSSAAVLIQGETGTGKELVAEVLHQHSRRSGEFVVVDCGAIPENLIESELFGYAKGAFTGATQSKIGAIEAAHGGTVFLDEIGELPLAVQSKLLRVIESNSVRKLGETKYQKFDVRFVAATHRNLELMVAEGTFREDLYFRLSVLPLFLPPLRERADDIDFLLAQFMGVDSSKLSSAVRQFIGQNKWKGNVRELRIFAQRLKLLGEVAVLSGDVKPTALSASAPVSLRNIDTTVPFKELKDSWLGYLEHNYLKAMLEKHQHNVTAVATASGLDRSYVHRMMKRYDL
jgi:transcriptional regulator with PAS, ATPase and Fis domain